MASTRPANYLEQSQRRARQFLDTNNSLTSKVSDEMISLLSAGEGSFYLRDQLDNVFNNIIHTGGNRTLGYDWSKLRQYMSIKDKVAYVTAIQHTRATTTRGNPINTIAEDDEIKETLNNIINELDTHLISNQEFTESWILRHAAINRFSCKLETKERASLNTLATKVKKLCSDEGFDILAEAVHFTLESDAQKIVKINEVLAQLSAMGVSIPDAILKDFSGSGEKNSDGSLKDGFERHILKLKNLDKAYKHLTNTLNMIHETAKTTEKSMVTPTQQKQLKEVMDKCEVRKTIEDAINDFNKDDNVQANNEVGTPMKLLKTVKDSSKFKEIVAEMGIENYFDQWFLSWITFELTHKAHTFLSDKKFAAFGGDMKKYNEDCNSRRGMMRRRIFEVYDRNAAQRGASSDDWDFADDADFDRMNSYYTKFPNLFFNSPDDNYDIVEGENPADIHARHFDKMRSILAALIRRRCTTLRSSNRIRRGSYPKIIVDWARHALKGDQRGIFKRIEQKIEWADDASIIAMTIMFQNQANNKLFYEEKDHFEPKEKRYSKIFKKVAGAEKGRQTVRDKFAPATDIALKTAETTAKGAFGATLWTAQKGASMVNTPLESINEWLSKQSAWNPIKSLMIATKPMQWLLNPLSKGIKYTDKDGKEQRMSIKEAMEKGYTAGTEALPVKEGEEKKTKYLYQWVSKGIGSITEFFGKSIADSGQWMHDQYVTANQRNVLGALYKAGQEEDRWKDLMRSGDLANMLDLRNIGPKLFDDDGRILPVDKPVEKCKDEINGKELGEKIKEEIEKLNKGIEDEINETKKNLNHAVENGKDNQDYFFTKLGSIQSRESLINDISGEIGRIVPALKNPSSAANLTTINDIIGNCTAGVPVVYTGLKLTIHNQLGETDRRINEINATQTVGLGRRNVTANMDNRRDIQWLINNAQNIINQQNGVIAQNQGNGQQQREDRLAAQNIINQQMSNIKSYNDRLKQINQEFLELSNRHSWLNKINSFITAIRDDNNTNHLDADSLKTLKDNLNLVMYRPQQQITQSATNNIASTFNAAPVAA